MKWDETAVTNLTNFMLCLISIYGTKFSANLQGWIANCNPDLFGLTCIVLSFALLTYLKKHLVKKG